MHDLEVNSVSRDWKVVRTSRLWPGYVDFSRRNGNGFHVFNYIWCVHCNWKIYLKYYTRRKRGDCGVFASHQILVISIKWLSNLLVYSLVVLFRRHSSRELIWQFGQSAISPSKIILLLFAMSVRASVSLLMLRAKQGNHWYHFDVFGTTRSFNGAWSRDISPSKHALYQ